MSRDHWKPTKKLLRAVRDCEHDWSPMDLMTFSDSSSQMLIGCPKCGAFRWIPALKISDFDQVLAELDKGTTKLVIGS